MKMRRHYLKYLVATIIVIGASYLYGATGTPSNLIVRTDANNYLVVAGAVQTNPVTQGVFSSRILKTDASGNLLVVQASGSAGFSASTCAAPALNETGATTTGIAFTATPSILQCIAGQTVTIATANLLELQNGTNPLELRIYKTFTSASNNEYGFGRWNGNVFELGTTDNGAGSGRSIRLGTFGDAGVTILTTGGLDRWTIGGSGNLSNSTTTFTTDVKLFDTIVTWNAAGVTFTGWKLVVTDTASAAGSLFLDLQTLAGGSLFKVAKTGLVSSNAGYQLTSVTVDSATAPTIASGGCTSPAIQTNGTAGIKVTIGTSCTGVKTIVLTFPAAAHFWSCNGNNITSDAAQQTNYPVFLATSTTSVTLTSYDRVLGTQEDFTASDIYLFNCRAE